MYYDLNVPWTSANDPELARTVAFLDELGYNVIALNYTFSGKIATKMTCPIPENPFPAHPRIRFLRRVTVILDDPSQNYNLPSLATSFDIVALRPTSEKILFQACSALDSDLISLDLSVRHPYHFKFKVLGLALSRGLRFEICYGASIHDLTARRNLLSNAAQLIRATRGKGIVVSSEAKRTAAARGMFDVINLATLWGLSQDKGMESVSEGARSVVVQAEIKRTSFRGVINVVDGGDGIVKVGDKRKAGEGKDKDVTVKATPTEEKGGPSNATRPSKRQRKQDKKTAGH